MTKKFKMGPLQRKFVKRLIEAPRSQQCLGILGKNDPDQIPSTVSYQACCLGEAALLVGIFNWDEEWRSLWCEGSDVKLNDEAAEKLGLHDGEGKLLKTVRMRGRNRHNIPGSSVMREFDSLLSMNDAAVSWKRIGEYIKSDPGNVFKESK